MLWLALIVPAAIAVYLYLYQRSRVLWWEYVVLFVVTALLIPIALAIVDTVQTRDTEYWGGWVTTARYYEPWDERVSCSHETGYRDSDGNWHHTGYEHAYDVSYHGPQWLVDGSNGEEISVNQATFEKLARQFRSRVFRELNRNFHSIDGDEYIVTYPNDVAVLEPLTTKHTYENRTQAADTVYKFPAVDAATIQQYKLYPYADVVGYYGCPTVLKPASMVVTGTVELEKVNALLGRSKQVRVWVMLFRNAPNAAAVYQQYLWKGGNKNELNVVVSLDASNTVQWARVFSWTEKNRIKVDVRDHLAPGTKFVAADFASWLKPEIEQHWERKQFKEFSYLEVVPPWWATLLVWVLTIAIDGSLAYWIVVNEFETADQRRADIRSRLRW